MVQPNLMNQPGDYHAYLVRLWQDGPNASWRAFAKEVLTKNEHQFASLEELFVFLEAQTVRNQERENREEE
jgi:hypothetical protein